MASESAEMIKDFLVGLGFKVDDAGGRKFSATVGSATSEVTKLGAAMVGAVALADVFVTHIAAGMDKLYFSTRRVGSTAQDISSFSYAISQLGGTIDGADAALEGLAAFRRTYLGADSILETLGVDSKHVNDSVKSVKDLSAHWRELIKQGVPFQMIKQQADLIGLGSPNDSVLTALLKPDFFKLIDEREAKLKASGIDYENLLDRNREFNQSLAETENSWHLVALQLEEHLLPSMKAFNEWSDKIATSLPKWMEEAGDWLLQARDHGVAATASDTADQWEWRKAVREWIYENLGTEATDKADAATRKGNLALRAPAINPSDPIGLRQNNPGAIKKWGSVPTKGGFAAFPTAQAGLSAMARNLLNYGENGWNTISEIVKHWSPGAGGNDEAAYRAHLSKLTGYGIDDKLNLRDAATLEKIMSAITVHENGRNPYSADLIDQTARDRLAQSKAGGTSTSTLTQTNHITVNAPRADADGIGKSVAGHVGNAGGRIIRNMQSAVN